MDGTSMLGHKHLPTPTSGVRRARCYPLSSSDGTNQTQARGQASRVHKPPTTIRYILQSSLRISACVRQEHGSGLVWQATNYSTQGITGSIFTLCCAAPAVRNQSQAFVSSPGLTVEQAPLLEHHLLALARLTLLLPVVLPGQILSLVCPS